MKVQRCKTCKSYEHDAKSRAGDCLNAKSPRPITTPEATCELWEEKTSEGPLL